MVAVVVDNRYTSSSFDSVSNRFSGSERLLTWATRAAAAK